MYACTVSKRADGELELEVLHILWGSEQPLHIGEVQELLESNLAYTSVATVLARLTTKELVQRKPLGRSYVYEPAISRNDWYSGKMMALLHETSNHRMLLAGFVSKLSSKDRLALQSLLSEEKEA